MNHQSTMYGFGSPHPPPPPPPPPAPHSPHAPPPAHGPPPPPGPPPGFDRPGTDFADFFNGPPGHGGPFHGHSHHHSPPGFGPGPDFFGRRGHRGGRGPFDDEGDWAEMVEQFRLLGNRGGRRGHGHGRHGHGRRGAPREEQEDTNEESDPEGFVNVDGEEREGSRPRPRGPPPHEHHGHGFGAPPPPPPPPPPPGKGWGPFGFGGPWSHFGGHGPWGGPYGGHFGGPHHGRGRGGFGRDKKPFPRVDILASEAQVILEIELPGVRKEDITARVDDEGSSVTIEGTFPERAEGELKRVYGERRTEAGAAFSRTIPLPGAVDKESVRAKLADGVLTITLAKVQVEEPQGTPVNIE